MDKITFRPKFARVFGIFAICATTFLRAIAAPDAASSATPGGATPGGAAAAATAGTPELPPPGQPAVLPPEQFFGEAKAGYDAAQQCPEIIAKLFCYCGCDMTDNHSALLDCFTSDHGADCQICRGEAVLALQMKKKGATLAQIQQAVDEKFAKEYPFNQPTKPLVDYRKNRLWKPSKTGAAADSKKTTGAPKLLPGKKAGNCCGAKATPAK